MTLLILVSAGILREILTLRGETDLRCAALCRTFPEQIACVLGSLALYLLFSLFAAGICPHEDDPADGR